MEHVERYGRAGRWFHVAVYLTVLSALITGWWFVVDSYDHPLLGLPDLLIHEVSGLLLVAVAVLHLVARIRAVRAFVAESVDREPGDGRWLAAWPEAAFTGRFPHHDGHYDPGQRLANLVMVGTLAIIAITGLVMLYVPLGRPLSALVVETHRWATFVLTPVIVGHIVIASGVLPGYRGVWRSMHLGGRLPVDVARRIWPGWSARSLK